MPNIPIPGMEGELFDRIKDACEELHDLYLPARIDTVPKPSSSTEILLFYRKYVQKNIPVKIAGQYL